MATLDELATFAATAGSLTVNVNCFKGSMPAKPDSCVAIEEYGGMMPNFAFNYSGPTDEMPRFQVLVRGTANDYATPRALAETLYRAFAAVANQVLSSTRYITIDVLGPPFKLRQDESGRYLVAFNCQADKVLS